MTSAHEALIAACEVMRERRRLVLPHAVAWAGLTGEGPRPSAEVLAEARQLNDAINTLKRLERENGCIDLRVADGCVDALSTAARCIEGALQHQKEQAVMWGLPTPGMVDLLRVQHLIDRLLPIAGVAALGPSLEAAFVRGLRTRTSREAALASLSEVISAVLYSGLDNHWSDDLHKEWAAAIGQAWGAADLKRDLAVQLVQLLTALIEGRGVAEALTPAIRELVP